MRSTGIALAVTLAAFSIGAAESNGERDRTAAPFRARAVSGKTLELKTLLRHGPVLLDFWATWCKPCLASLPGIQEIHERFEPAGLTVIGVSIDGPRNYAKVRPFVARLGLSYPIVLDRDGRIQRDYHVTAVPTAALIDTSGTVVLLQRGYRPGEDAKLAAAIEELLPEASRPGNDPRDTDGPGAAGGGLETP